MAIGRPFEMLELQHQESVTFRVREWEEAQTTITTRDAPNGKVIDVIRVEVPKEDKPVFPHYWDITSARLVAQIRPHLQAPGYDRKRFTITAYGVAPKKNFTLDVLPL